MWKHVMPYFLLYHYGIILSFKVCNMKSIFKQYAASRLESHILLVEQCHGGWNLDPSFWIWIQVAVSERTPYNILKEDEIQEFTVEILGTFFRLIKLLFFWTSCLVPRGITVKSDHYIEVPCHLNVCLHWVCPARKMSQVLHYHGSAQLHTSAHTTEAITNYRVATSTLQFLPCTSRLLSVFSFKKKKKACRDTIMPVTMHHRVSCVSGHRWWRTTFTRKEYILVYRGGRRLLAAMGLHCKIVMPPAMI